MKKYRKLPVTVEAVQYTGRNQNEIFEFVGQELARNALGYLWIPTMEGHVKASPTDYIIKGVKGEFYPCNAEVFAETYEPIL